MKAGVALLNEETDHNREPLRYIWILHLTTGVLALGATHQFEYSTRSSGNRRDETKGHIIAKPLAKLLVVGSNTTTTIRVI